MLNQQNIVRDHKWAGGVRYVRGGGESMRIAIRLARAFTRKEIYFFVVTTVGMIGIQANHKSKNLDFQLLPGLNLGVPKGLSGTVIPLI